jgi:hypothetical protein
MTLWFLLLGGVVLLCLMLSILLLKQRKRVCALKQELNELAAQLASHREKSESFAQDLLVAERTRPQENKPAPSNMSERFRYIKAMARQGMKPGQIAEILQMGEVEVAQIVRLALLKKDQS